MNLKIKFVLFVLSFLEKKFNEFEHKIC